jgi:hypothetical protein
MQQRWRLLPGEDRTVNLYLDNLLAAQVRLALAEYGYLKSSTTYNLSLVNLKKAQGTLLQDEGVDGHSVLTGLHAPTGEITQEVPDVGTSVLRQPVTPETQAPPIRSSPPATEIRPHTAPPAVELVPRGR